VSDTTARYIERPGRPRVRYASLRLLTDVIYVGVACACAPETNADKIGRIEWLVRPARTVFVAFGIVDTMSRMPVGKRRAPGTGVAEGFWATSVSQPDRIAIVDGEASSTFGELGALVNRLSRGLRRHGLLIGDIVACSMANSELFLAVQLAVLQLGAYFLPLDTRLGPSEALSIIGKSRPRTLLCDQSTLALAGAVSGRGSGADMIACGPPPLRPVTDLLDENETAPERRFAGENLFFSSGTTGEPKGVLRPLRGMTPEAAATRWVAPQLSTFDLERGDGRHLVISSLAHPGPNLATLRALHIGHTVVICHHQHPTEVLQAIEHHRITSVQMVPSFFAYLLSIPEEVRRRYDVSSLRHVIHTGDRCPLDM